MPSSNECLSIKYGHPDPDVLADLAGTTILRTDTEGTVSVGME
jgi:beta-lactamase superfamily II metal-dependent hydrolase